MLFNTEALSILSKIIFFYDSPQVSNRETPLWLYIIAGAHSVKLYRVVQDGRAL